MPSLAELVATASTVRDTAARGGKVAALADLLRRLEPDEVPAAVAFLSGELLQRQIGIGWASLRDLPPAAAEPSLTLREVADRFEEIAACSGGGSQTERRRLLRELLGRATADEQALLRALLSEGLRLGAQEGVMADAVARATNVPPAELRRALMLRGDLPAVASVALTEGAPGLAALGLRVGRPLLPMLAQSASDVGAALERTGPAAVEWKLDGARIQVHRDGGEVAVFTRTLDDVTARVPEVVELALALPARAFVLDGEAIALRPDGRPHPFQVTGSRFATRDAAVHGAVPLTPMLFDVLHLDGEDLLDRPGSERAPVLEALLAQPSRVPRLDEADAEAATVFFDAALQAGHEGVVVKALAAPYEAGRRGAAWVKVKPVHTLDLVVLAVEWGSGRRQGWLSNLHLGARDPNGGFVMLGKTFKGLTDELLTWQTEQLLARETSRLGHVVFVRPELVVEIAFDGVQTSPRYPGGVALRFARVKRYRPDKTPAEADTIESVLALRPS
jgi:DNA ligase-1